MMMIIIVVARLTFAGRQKLVHRGAIQTWLSIDYDFTSFVLDSRKGKGVREGKGGGGERRETK